MTEHAILGGSSAKRWMACPGSIRLAAGLPEPEDSEYAIEGSAAHALAEFCLTEGHDAAGYVGKSTLVDRGGLEKVEVEVTEDMAEAVQVYLDHVRAHSTDSRLVEVRVSLEPLDPPVPMFGTADCVEWDPETRILDIFDYKHGQGVVVEAEENEQLIYYALGVVLTLRVRPEKIRVWIVQPRAPHPEGPIRSWEFGWDRLLQFRKDVISAAHEAMSPDAPIGPVGDHCRFCPAMAICPAQRENAIVVAQSAFVEGPAEPALPAPSALSQDMILEVLEKAPYVEDWFKEIRSYVQGCLERGEEVPGWKLVPKRAYRRWRSEEDAEAFLRGTGLRVGDLAPRKLVSPAQAEKLLKKAGKDLPDDFVSADSSGFNLAHESNPRPAVTPASIAAEAFSAEEE